MKHYEYLLATRTKEELAKLLVREARENAALKDRADALSHELFWTNVKQRKENQDEHY